MFRRASNRAQAGHSALQAAVSDLEKAVDEAEAEGTRAVAMVEKELEEERTARAELDRRTRDLELELAGLRAVADRVEKAEVRADRAEARADKLEAKADQALADLATARADLATARAGA
jgi:chromosome segregation ATPase